MKIRGSRSSSTMNWNIRYQKLYSFSRKINETKRVREHSNRRTSSFAAHSNGITWNFCLAFDELLWFSNWLRATLSRKHDAMTPESHARSASLSLNSLTIFGSVRLFVCLFVHDANNQFNVFVTSHCWRARVKYLPPTLPTSRSIESDIFPCQKLENEWNESKRDKKTKLKVKLQRSWMNSGRLLLLLLKRLRMWSDFLRLSVLAFRLAQTELNDRNLFQILIINKDRLWHTVPYLFLSFVSFQI